MVLKIFVRFTLKELKCGFYSYVDIISEFEKGGILFLQIAVIFEMKNIRGLENIGYRNKKQEEKRSFNNLTRNKTRRQGVFFSEGLILVVRTGRNSFFDSFFIFNNINFQFIMF